MTRLTTGVAALAVTVLAVPSPASAVDDTNGLSCGITTTAAPGRPDHFTGVVTGGPYASLPGSDLTVVCRLVRVGGVPVFTVIGSVGADPVRGFAFPVGFQAAPGETLYLCTSVTYHDGSGGRSEEYDADGNPANGRQCAVLVELDQGGRRSYFLTPAADV